MMAVGDQLVYWGKIFYAFTKVLNVLRTYSGLNTKDSGLFSSLET